MRLRSIRARILAVFLLSLSAFAGALGYGLVQLQAIGDSLRAINEGYLPLAGIAADLSAVVRQMDRDLDRLGREGPRPIAGHRSNAAFYSTNLADDLARGQTIVSSAQAIVANPEERRAMDGARLLLGQLETQRVAFEAASAAWLESADDPTRGVAGQVEVDRRRKELTLLIDQLSALVEGRITAVSVRTEQAQNRALTVSGTLAGLAALLAGVMAGVALLTLRPIARLTAQVQRLAAGQTAGRVDVRSGDEVGVLAREFNAMAEAVAERDRRLSERAAALDRLSLRLRRVLDTIRAGLVVVDDAAPEDQAVDAAPAIAMANPAASRLWGAGEGTALPAPLARLLPSDGSALPRRWEMVSLGGRLFDVDVVPFGPRGTLIAGEDVTERVQDRERLARSERLALVGQMLAQITHEVRNPLNAMSLNAELLAEDITDPEARAMLATITGEIRRLEQLTARYLDLSRRRRPEPVSADPLSLVAEVARMEEGALRRVGVTISVTGNSPGVVVLDADALRRALRNVIRNAVEAGAKRVDVSVEPEPERVVVTVRDDGPGMDASQADQAFEPFYTTKAQGTGLGLAISRQELEDSGGALRCEAPLGKGCTFTLSVPISEETAGG